jgi:hypothetical protein
MKIEVDKIYKFQIGSTVEIFKVLSVRDTLEVDPGRENSISVWGLILFSSYKEYRVVQERRFIFREETIKNNITLIC